MTGADFARYSQSLDAAGMAWPRLIIDAARLAHNTGEIARLAGSRPIRLVDKSLPSPALLKRLSDALGTRHFMSFHAPLTVQTALAFPDAHILMGKPLPIRAVETVISALDGRFDWENRLVWLADTPEALAGLDALAQRTSRTLAIALEIDIGLHRGGAGDLQALSALLDGFGSGHVRLAGLMGYDAHLAAASWPVSRSTATRRSQECYRACIALVEARGLLTPELIFNGAGSPTLALQGDSPCNEVSVGSAFVKPSDFDVAGLEALLPAAFIAAPILKRMSGVPVPLLPALSRIAGRGRDTLCLYGGKWMADPVWPPTLRADRLFGESSNQQRMIVDRRTPAAPGDWAYFRPNQSEAVLMQFGPLVLIDADGSVTELPIHASDLAGITPEPMEPLP